MFHRSFFMMRQQPFLCMLKSEKQIVKIYRCTINFREIPL